MNLKPEFLSAPNAMRCFIFKQTTFQRQIKELPPSGTHPAPLSATSFLERAECFQACHFTSGCQSVRFDSGLCQLYDSSDLGQNGDDIFVVIKNESYSEVNDLTTSRCTRNGYIYDRTFSICYKPDITLANNTYAHQLCSQSGGRLMVVDSLEKQNLIESITFPTGTGVSNFRIDAFKSGGIWRFADGRVINSFYWGTGQPDKGYTTICIDMITHKWNDVHVNYNHAILCEKAL
ncbi:uncharacterized protein LOC133192360 [Saccostrea echinata]|uniref:uncharacterized protein LOC133192360 n=1 Tax=Saccostrea echinata TaxID=191078 RepID=UPI002A7EF622|nr:uncharacterized protein LOC133192360 [Saccostrea echinata]